MYLIKNIKCKLTIDNKSRNVRSLHSVECCRTNFGPTPSHCLVNIFSNGYFFIHHLHQYSHVGKIVIHLVSRWEVPGVKFIRDHDAF